MDMRLQPQGFARRQPGAPQAETRVAEHPPFRRRPAWAPVMCLQTTQMGGELLQMHESLLEWRPLCRRVRRRPLTGLHDLVDGDFLMRHVMPEPAQRLQRRRRRVQDPADAPLPADDPPPKYLFLGKAEQGKMTDFTKILSDHIVSLRVCRAEAPLRRRVLLHRS